MTRIDFNPSPNSSLPSNVPAANGLRYAYMQKYVQNAASAATTIPQRRSGACEDMRVVGLRRGCRLRIDGAERRSPVFGPCARD